MTELLTMTNVHASYGAMTVLRGIDLHIDEGTVVLLLGANGAGKTTTLRAISGTVATTGELTFAGSSLLGSRPEQMARRGIAHVPQGRGTFGDLSVEENLRIGAYLRKDSAGISADIATWYDRFPRLGERRAQAAGLMSGGEQQMLAIARAMMSRPRLLMLDEPSLGLAPKIVHELFGFLREVNAERGTSMLIVEQNAELALRFADRGYVLEAGSIVLSATAAELAVDERVRDAYLGKAG